MIKKLRITLNGGEERISKGVLQEQNPMRLEPAKK